MMLVSPSHGYLTRSQCHAFAATHRNIARESVPRCVRNVKCTAASVADTQASTSLGTKGLILPRGQPGSWDEGTIGSPVVQCFIGDDEQRWFMWYNGRQEASDVVDVYCPSAGRVGIAVSSNGVDWTRGTGTVAGDRDDDRNMDVGQVLGCSEEWWTFDTRAVGVSDVQIFSNNNVSGGVGVYWMMYTGANYEAVEATGPHLQALCSSDGNKTEGGHGVVEGLKLRAGLAMSQDGRNWARIEGDHHTGALVVEGEPGEWDEAGIWSPTILAAGPGDMRLLYVSAACNTGVSSIGLALSENGFRWKKQGIVLSAGPPGSFSAAGVCNPQLVRDLDSKMFVMFYEGIAEDGSRSIGMATSQDGMQTWDTYPQPVLTAAEAGAWDGGSVGTPCAVQMAGSSWRLYYAGRAAGTGSWEGIGLALSGEGDLFHGVPTVFKRR